MSNQQSVKASFNAVTDYFETFLHNQTCLSDNTEYMRYGQVLNLQQECWKTTCMINHCQLSSGLSVTEWNPGCWQSSGQWGCCVTVTSVRGPKWSYCLVQIMQWPWWCFSSLNTKYLGLWKKQCSKPVLPCTFRSPSVKRSLQYQTDIWHNVTI